MLLLLMSIALAQDPALPTTTCDDETQMCLVHRDRITALVGKANSADELKRELIMSADKIDQLALELFKAKAIIDSDTSKLMELEAGIAEANQSVRAARKQRNIAYTVTLAVAGGLIAGAYITRR